MRTLVFLMLLLLAACGTSAQTPGPLAGKWFQSTGDVLVVFLHGDLYNNDKATAAEDWDFVERLSKDNPDAAVFALIRPGYSDGQNTSVGRKYRKFDHYTKANNDLVAETISNLKAHTKTSRVVAIAHSGGAAQLGSIIGRYPGLVDSAVLVSCPCDTKQWMSGPGKTPLRRSQSPVDFVAGIADTTRVIAITGLSDTNTKPSLAEAFVKAAVEKGIDARFKGIPAAGHAFMGSLRDEAAAVAAAEIKRQLKRN